MKVHIITYAILISTLIFLSIRHVAVNDKLDQVRTEKSYLDMQMAGHLETLKEIQHRRQIEDSLRAIKSPQYEENLRLIRSATDADLKRLIEGAADTTGLRLLFP